MMFDVRAGSDTFHYPVYSFPGDEVISREDYERAIFSGYLSSVSSLYGVARGYGLAIDTETFERWKRCCASAGLLDDFLDESPDIADANLAYQAKLNEIVENDTDDFPLNSELDERLPFAINLLKNSVNTLPEKKKDSLLLAARKIGSIAVRKSKSNDIEEYINSLIEEGRLTSVLITASVSEYVNSQEGFNGFEKWCVNALECATLLDSVRDLKRDVVAGRVQVAPSVRNRVKVLLAARHSAQELYATHESRHATLAGIATRISFSKYPTEFTMRQVGLNSVH